jgi:probable rRNA maturation factor
MEIQIKFQKRVQGLTTQTIKRITKRLLEDLACDKQEASILFTDDRRIAGLNREYRGKDKPTNVLSFSMTEGPLDMESGMLGDVVISVDTALREASDRGETVEETVYRLLVHGLLHLMGYDHERSPQDEKIMTKEEKRLLKLIREENNGASGSKH